MAAGVKMDMHEEIAPVPAAARKLGPLHLGVLWGDLAVGLLVLVAGGLLVPGLGLRDALIAAAIGSVIGAALLAITGRIGTDTGVPTMVALRPALGPRGSYAASGLNVLQLIGWAGLELIIMAQAARTISGEFFGFDGYYFWLALFALLATAFAIGGPVVFVREVLQRFGLWIVIAASIWLTVRLFETYDIHERFDDAGAGGFPTFWQGVDLAVALPVSWLPLVADYSRYARRATAGAWATFASYAAANAWFFALGASYALVLTYDASNPNNLVGALADMMLPLTLGWLFLLVILADETDNAFADVYSAAVSVQNVAPVGYRVLAAVAGLASFVLAVSLDLLGYETFLLLIGGVFVSLFGVLVADYFVVHRGRYDGGALFERGGRYWSWGGVNPAGVLAWAAGFVTYAVAGQPPWLLERIESLGDVPSGLTRIGGTIPAFVVSFAAYLLLERVMRAWAPRHEAAGVAEPAS
jgi:putative hydroxymethylpyrimidine transporter CytX